MTGPPYRREQRRNVYPKISRPPYPRVIDGRAPHEMNADSREVVRAPYPLVKDRSRVRNVQWPQPELTLDEALQSSVPFEPADFSEQLDAALDGPAPADAALLVDLRTGQVRELKTPPLTMPSGPRPVLPENDGYPPPTQTRGLWGGAFDDFADRANETLAPKRFLNPELPTDNGWLWPYSAVARLFVQELSGNWGGLTGSASIVAPAAALSCMHCIYGPWKKGRSGSAYKDGSRPKFVAPGYADGFAPFGIAAVVGYVINKGWFSADSRLESLARDVALLLLDRPIGFHSGYFAVTVAPEGYLPSYLDELRAQIGDPFGQAPAQPRTRAFLAGYPDAAANVKQVWEPRSSVLTTGGLIQHKPASEEYAGFSGGPLLLESADGRFTQLGVNTGWRSEVNPAPTRPWTFQDTALYGTAARVTAAIYDALQKELEAGQRFPPPVDAPRELDNWTPLGGNAGSISVSSATGGGIDVTTTQLRGGRVWWLRRASVLLKDGGRSTYYTQWKRTGLAGLEAPALFRNDAGRVMACARDLARAGWLVDLEAGDEDVEPLGGVISQPIAAAFQAGRAHVFAVGPDGRLYQRASESWRLADDSPQQIQGGATLVSRGSQWVDVFVRVPSDRVDGRRLVEVLLWRTFDAISESWQGTWQVATSPATIPSLKQGEIQYDVLSDPAVVADSTGQRLDVVVREYSAAPVSSLLHGVWLSASGWNWIRIEATARAATSPALIRRDDKGLDAFYRDDGGEIQWIAFAHEFSNFEWFSGGSLGGAGVGRPAAVALDSRSMDVLIVGPDSAVWIRSYRDGAWSHRVQVGRFGKLDQPTQFELAPGERPEFGGA